MKKRFKKFMALAVAVMMCVALTGCMHTVEKISIDKDGSGTVKQQVFYSVSYVDEQAANLAEGEEETLNGKTYEEIQKLPVQNINGEDYYMDEEKTKTFASPDEFSRAVLSDEGSGVIMALTDNGDGSFSLDIGEEEEEEPSEDVPNISLDELGGIGESATFSSGISAVYEITFNGATKVEQTKGKTGDGSVSISNNTVNVTIEDATNSFAYSFKAYYTNNGSATAGDKSAFTDVPQGAWYYEAVSAMAKAGIVNGYGNGKFGPTDKVTVAQVCQILSKLYAGKTIDGATIDVGTDNGYWAYKAIESMKGIGSLQGGFGIYDKDITSANYDVPATREIAIAAAAYTYCEGIADEATVAASIPDASAISADCAKWVNEAYRIGLTHGVDAKGTFNPGATLTRAELCQMIYNITK